MPLNGIKNLKPDLILIDIMMPQMDGSQVVSILKSDPVLNRIPVIFLSALAISGDDIKLENLMVDGEHYTMVAKPFEREYLLSKVREVLKQ